MTKRIVLAALIALSPLLTIAQEATGTITILEGAALIYRGQSRLQATEGVRVGSDDIIEMGPKGFMQIELNDRSVLQLGPRSRAMLSPVTARGSVHALEGWFKLIADHRDARSGSGLGLRSALLDVPAQNGARVIKISPADAAAFAESSESKLLERQPGGQVAVSLKLGDFYQRKAGAKGAINSGGRGAFVAEMPPVFKDSLPSRLDRYREKPVPPRPAADFSYADVEAWLKGDPEIRKQLVVRWRAKAAEPAFRSALIANLNDHPEWESVVSPDKHATKPPSPPPVARRTEPPRDSPPPAAQPPAPAASRAEVLPPPVQ